LIKKAKSAFFGTYFLKNDEKNRFFARKYKKTLANMKKPCYNTNGKWQLSFDSHLD
jgi:hypothetical protein